MKLLLDSHTLLWAVYDPAKLPKLAAEVIADSENELFVSHISILELANKAASDRLPLVGPSTIRLLERIRELGATFLPIQLEEILAAANLPRHHADPLDRILIVQANFHDLQLVTCDGDIPKYDVKTIWK